MAETVNLVRALWDAGEPAILGWLQLASPLAAEALSLCGYDGLVVDLQHSTTDFAAAAAMFTAIEGRGVEPFVRVQSNDAADIGKLLDAGAYGVIVPMIENAGQATAFARALHYPPNGARSFGPRRPLLRYGAGYQAVASQIIVSLAMIETLEGLRNLDAILAVDGLDGVFIGPADLALALGYPPVADSDAPEIMAVIADIRGRAHAAGKRVGIFCGSSAFARVKIEEGFDLVTLTPDLVMTTASARLSVAEARGR